MLKFYPLFVLVALLGCQPGDMFYRDMCGDKEYNKDTGLTCENGTLKCGDDYYDPDTSNQFCSNAQLYDKCNGQTYSVSTEKCQNDILLTKCENSYYDLNILNQFCSNNQLYDKCNGQTYNVSTEKCQNDTLLTKCGDYYYNPRSEDETQFCSGNKLYDKCGGKSYDPRTSIYCSDGELVFDYKVLIDSRNGKEYKTIIIGTQNWMAENLRYETSNTKCLSNNPDNCEIYGIAYDWNAAKTVCPAGWHLPSDEEWDTLKNFTWNYHYAGYELKANSDLWGNSKGTDRYGFSALPGAYFGEERILGVPFFSSTDFSETHPGFAKTYVILSDELELLSAHNSVNSTWAYVRCVEDI
ncbi:MAG: hypothetical protein FWC26_14125 [Fibromonadales bacterium]|nr:hypothetical protein [Fibromonadales bacterium]